MFDIFNAFGNIDWRRFTALVEDATGAATDEIAETAKEIARRHAEEAEALVRGKTGHAAVLSGYVIIPVALFVGALAIKILYGIFTKTADKIGAGIHIASATIQSAVSAGEGKKTGGKEEKAPKARLLFGEILRLYVAPAITEEDIRAALAKQTEIKTKLIGEILLESGKITKSDLAKVMKYQLKR